jgi:hypothetical protein
MENLAARRKLYFAWNQDAANLSRARETFRDSFINRMATGVEEVPVLAHGTYLIILRPKLNNSRNIVRRQV